MTSIEELDLLEKIAKARRTGKTSLDSPTYSKMPSSPLQSYLTYNPGQMEDTKNLLAPDAMKPNALADPVDMLAGGIGGAATLKAVGMTPKIISMLPGMKNVSSAVGDLTPRAVKWLATAGAESPLRRLSSEFMGMQAAGGAYDALVPEDWKAAHPAANALGGLAASFAGAPIGAIGAKGPDTLALAEKVLAPLSNDKGSISIPDSGTLSKLNLWQQAGIGDKISQIGDRLGSVPLIPEQSRLAKYLNGNTPNQWITSPVLRMPGESGNLFTRNQTEGDRISRAYREMGLNVKDANLNLDQTEDLKRVMRGGFDLSKTQNPDNVDLITKLMTPVVQGTVTGVRKLVSTEGEQKMLSEGLNDRLLKIFKEDPDHPLWQAEKNYTGRQFDLTTNEGTVKFLDHVLTDPTVDPIVKQIAKDNYDIAAKTAQEVSAAHTNAYTSLLKSKILNNPDWAIPQVDLREKILEAKIDGDAEALKDYAKVMKDYVEIPHDKFFDGMLVHKTIAEGINDFETHVSTFRKGWNKYVLNPWKFMKTGLNVPARPRDAMSNLMFNDIGGEHPLSPYRVDLYGPALKEVQQALRGKGESPDLAEFFHWSGGRPEALNSIALDPVFDAMKHNANPMDNVLGMMYNSKLGQAASGAMNAVDLWTKYAKFKWNVANGMAPENAAYDAMRTVGDHMLQTKATRAVRDTLMPFFGWQAHAMRTVANGFMQHPIRTAKWYAGPYLAGQASLNALGITNNEWEDMKKTLPEYLTSSPGGMPTHIPLPVRDEKGRIQLMDIGYWLPGLQDMSEMNQNVSDPLRFAQNPAFTLLSALKDNKKFSGAPIWNEWDEPGTKAAKFFGYAGQQVLPPMTPILGTHFQKIADSYNENNENALTPGQAWGTQVGYRVTPFEENEQLRKFQARQDAFINEARHQMKSEMLKARTDDEASKIQNEYLDIIEKLQGKKNLE